VRPRKKTEPVPPERARELDAYRWSSHRAYAGRSAKPEWLCLDWLSGWGKRVGGAQRAYRKAMAEVFGRVVPSPWEDLRGGLVLGTEELWEKTRKLVRAKEANEELRWTERQGARRVQRAVKSLVKRESDADVRLWARVRLGGEGRSEVARDCGYGHPSGVTHAVNRVEEKAQEDRELAEKLEALRKQLSLFKR